MRCMTVLNNQPRKQRRLHHIESAVEYLSGAIKKKTLEDWIWRRQIETVRIGRRVCIPEDALDRLIESSTTPALGDAKPVRTPRKSPPKTSRPNVETQSPG
jgi:excisionase family DNA binding protein